MYKNYPNEILKNLYLGSILSIKYMKEIGIEEFVDLTNLPIKVIGSHGYRLQIDDDPKVNISQYFDPMINIIDKHLTENRKILIFCFKGVSRSATIILAYMAYKRHKLGKIVNLDKLISKLRRRRPTINPNPGFMEQLKVYVDTLNTTHENINSSINNVVTNYDTDN